MLNHIKEMLKSRKQRKAHQSIVLSMTQTAIICQNAKHSFFCKKIQECIDWIKGAGLCVPFSVKEHRSKECKQEVKCNKCNSFQHETILHQEIKVSSDGEAITSKRAEINGKNLVAHHVAKQSWLIFSVLLTKKTL